VIDLTALPSSLRTTIAESDAAPVMKT